MDELSVSVPAIPTIKAQVRRLSHADCQELARRAQLPHGRRSSRPPSGNQPLNLQTMAFFSNAFSYLQKIGKCMMLPVSVLPVAGILLGVGSANFPGCRRSSRKIMAQSGGAIFSNLPLLFAIGVAIGLTNNDGVAALASTVGFAVFLATMGVLAKMRGIETATAMGIPTIETGVFGGIIVGLIAARAFNRFYKVQLPSYLGFLCWKALGADHHGLYGYRCRGDSEFYLAADWQRDQCVFPLGGARATCSHLPSTASWSARSSPLIAPRLERAVLFQAGDFVDPSTGKEVHGEIALHRGRPDGRQHDRRLSVQDVGSSRRGCRHHACSSSGESRQDWRRYDFGRADGVLTGITEPIEFAFSSSRRLYIIHALLAGVAYLMCILLGIRHGFTFRTV